MPEINGLQLIAGLILPWWAGYEIVRRLAADAAAGHGIRARQFGNGFFVGYALLVLLVRMDSMLTGAVSWTHVAVTLVVLALGARFIMPVHASTPSVSTTTPIISPIHRILITVLLCWLLAHLWFNGIEIVTIPVFPWDAWAVWVYRAKAWFGQTGLFEFLTLQQWLDTTDADRYVVTALKYPWFASITPYWTALSMGAWHESLVGLPVALLGPALALAFYGQLRAHGLQAVAALIFSWFLVSTPLLCVHLSLAGYADIWMAGFTGLGFIALLRFLLDSDRRQLILGAVLLAIGATIKSEGVVWLLAGLVLLLLARARARWLLAACAAIVAIVLVSLVIGTTVIDVPGLGRIGLDAGRLYLPYVGSHELVVNDLRWAYWDNMFQRGSWHLAWLLVLAAFITALIRNRELRPVWAFLVTVMMVNVLIFVFSDQGRWAQDYTAINRVPLQVYPALLFCVAVVWKRLARPGLKPPGILATLLITAVSGIAVLSAALWLESHAVDERQTEPVSIGPGHLTFVLGGGDTGADVVKVDRFEQGLALLSTGPVTIDADNLYLLNLDFQYDWSVAWPEQAPAFFWRRADEPQLVSRRTLRDARVFDLSDSEDWRGTIIEAGFVILQNEGQPAILSQAEITGPEAPAILDEARREWASYEPWTQRSANLVFGGAFEQHLPLTLLVTFGILLAAAWAGLLFHRNGRDAATGILLVVLLGWSVLDARWTRNRLEQFVQSWHTLRNTSVEDRVRQNETALYHDWIAQLNSDYLGTEPRRVLLVHEPGITRYHARRAKYELLPHSVAVVSNFSKIHRLDTIDFILLMCDVESRGDDPQTADKTCDDSDWARIPRQLAPGLQALVRSPYGTLVRIKPSS